MVKNEIRESEITDSLVYDSETGVCVTIETDAEGSPTGLYIGCPDYGFDITINIASLIENIENIKTEQRKNGASGIDYNIKKQQKPWFV